MDQVPIESKPKRNLIDLRMTEIEVREEITNYLRDVYEQKLWRKHGYRTINDFCQKELGYTAAEIRQRLAEIGAIVTSESMVSSDRKTQERIDQLRSWRRSKSSVQAVSAYRIFTNKTLMEIAALNPKTKDELRQAYGMGDKKTAEFGDEILDVLKETDSDQHSGQH